MTMLARNRKPTGVLINTGEINKKDVEVDWKDKLRKWRKVQLSSGAVNSLTDKNQSVFQSCSVSVLGCLQASFTADQLKNKIEESLVNGLRRSAGLDLISFAMEQTHSQELFYESLQWFSGSLRFNKGKTTHYLDGLEGCGAEAEKGVRKQFFAIIKRVIWQFEKITAQTAEEVMKCKKAEDHESIKKLYQQS